jgi:Leucine-rich repeat (LRR) protein
VISDPSAEYYLTNAPKYHVQFIAGYGGSLSGNADQYVYEGNSCTAVTAVPNPGFYFVDWTGSYTGTDNPLTIASVSSDMTITANFALISAADDRARLILLYNSTNGDAWYDNSGWKTPPLHTDGFALPGTEGSWFGITASGGAVTEIELYSNNLTGGIIPQLGDMANLQLLYLSSNNLTGPIPAELAGATNISVLDLSHNQLTGTIPVELGSLSNLEYLDMNSNQLTGTIPAELGSLTNLYGLSLFSNSLSGEIPVQLGNLAKLQTLNLSYNQLTGSIPTQLGNLSLLRILDLQYNQLTGTFPVELGSLTALQELDLSSNQISGSIPAQLGNLTALEGLYLRENRLTGNVPAALGNCSELRTLNLELNGLKGPLPDTLLQLINLSYLDIEYNALYPTSAEMEAFLDLWNYGWKQTQTLAPTDVQAAVVSSTSIDLTWTPIQYHDDPGGYRIFYANTPGGPYTFYRQTANKSTSSLRLTGLKPGPYYFIIRTQTNAHGSQANILESDNSQEATCNTIFINLTSPNGGENWQIGSGKTITWNSSGLNCFCRLELWNGASKVGVIARKVPVTAGSYYWMAGNCNGVMASPGSGYQVKIIPYITAYSDTSDSGFTLATQPYIKVMEPAEGDILPLGSSRVITWLSSGVSGSCSIELWKDGVGKVGTIVSNYTVSTKSYLWTVGQYQGGTAAAGPGYKIKIIADSGPSDIMDAPFTIVNSPTVTMTSPNGGETWTSGNIQAITWSSSNVGAGALCYLELYKNNVRLGNIASGLSLADGTYSWTVGQYSGGTAPAGNDYKVRIAIISEGREERSDLSNANFTIQ